MSRKTGFAKFGYGVVSGHAALYTSALIASSLLLANCGGESIVAAYAVEKATGNWFTVAEKAKADALRGDSDYYLSRAAVLYFRESMLA